MKDKFWSKAMLMNQKAKFDPVTFTSNGTWIVPRGIKQIAVDCVAAQGWNVYDGHGLGGRVQCILNVTPKEILHITVGIARTSAAQSVYNASDIRTVSDDMNTRLIVAGAAVAQELDYLPEQDFPALWEWLARLEKLRDQLN